MKRMLFQFTRKKYFLMYVFVVVIGLCELHAQSTSIGNVGAGVGLSYGGIGARFTYTPISELGLFGSWGYNLNELGYNFGLQLHIPSEKRLSFYATGMYGYNTVLIVDAIVMESKTTYYGISTGVGAEFKFKGKSFLSAEVLVPFRSQVYKKAIDDLEAIDYKITEPFPIAICIGYHLRF